jgi:ferredoxin
MVVLLLILPMNILRKEIKMAKLTNKKTGESVDIKEDTYIRRAAEELGVVFCCNVGRCGSCCVDIKEGEDNLTEPTQEEKDFGFDNKRRLACQCKIKSGEVVIED